MNTNGPEAIGDILRRLVQGAGLGDNLDQAKIWEYWPELAGPRLCGHGEPKTIKDGTLHVTTDNSVSMHEFALRKWDIIGRINARAGRELVSDIFLTLRDDDGHASPTG
ncbi:MAG: DUF721 domain-containing protein [Candidatus Hydrogenedentes bacterium]|nr:DUF721 domain-containing protein [Candidatus Hydrogenedentota bacterium]